MMNTMFLDEESMYLCKKREKHPDIVSHRRTKHSDLPDIRKLIQTDTFEMFGNVNCNQIIEGACLSLVQLNEKEEIVSHVSLYNYPNVPSIPRNDWLCWIIRHYGLESVSSGNTLFIHFLVWDARYTGEFLTKLLNAIFSMTTFCLHVILMHPPLVVPVDGIEKCMARVVPKWEQDTNNVQALYITIRHRKDPKLTLRLAVEEDNDDIVRIIDAETKRLKEVYGEYYISEMMRYPDGQRRIIVSEYEGIVTGVMCITKVIDLNLLNDVFELGPYNGLRKCDGSEIKNQGHVNGLKSDSTCFQRPKGTRNILRLETGLITEEGNDSLFVCPCSHQKSLKNGGNCPVCFPGAAISKVNESFESLEDECEVEREEIEVVESVVTHIERIGEEEEINEVAVEEKENKEDITEKEETENILEEEDGNEDYGIEEDEQDFLEEKESRGDIEIEEGKKREAILKERVKTQREENEGKESEKNDQVKEESSKLFFKNMKVKNLSETAFPSLLMSNDEDQDSGLNQLDNPSRRGTISGIEVSEFLLEEFKASNLSSSTLKGEPNAFILEVFSSYDDTDELRNQIFLQAAFECFPDVDYCAILLPSTHQFFPLMKNFVRVPLRFNKDFPMVLYLTHRAVFFGTFKSREAVPYDLEENLNQLLYGISGREAIIADCQEAVLKENSEMECFVFFCDDSLIGVALLSFEREINFLRRHYHIDDYVSNQNVPIDGHGRLLHYVIMPIFAMCHQFFYREILRLSEMSILYYRLYASDASALTRTHPFVNCLNVMIPVEPRIKTEFIFQHYYEKNAEPPMSCQEKERFSLFLMTPQLATISKQDINTKIVVVGASDCGMAFIEFLSRGSNLNFANFTNLTLISTNGLPYEKKSTCLEKRFIPFKGRYCHVYRHMKAARAWFNVITGTVIDINRKEKYVTVKGLGFLTYDYLILTCGLQFQKPRLPKEIQGQDREYSMEHKTLINCLSINDDVDAAICIKKLQNWTANFSIKRLIVFYGSNIECYCALNAFLEMGVKSSWITLIEPPLPGNANHDKIFANDSEVNIAVMNQIAESGVEILSGWNLIDWELEDNLNGGKVIKNLKIESNSETKTVPCDILMSFSEKRIHLETFMAFSRAGLVFDGLLVINPKWRTNDPLIFAAGTATKYSRKYMIDLIKLKYFNSLEVGERLAKYLKRKIESHLQEEEMFAKSKSRKCKSLPNFQVPRSISCILPGGFHYLHVQKPGKKIEREEVVPENSYGEVCITGSCTSNIGYFRIGINSYGFIESITCFSKKSFEVQNLISLYGKHESLLNDLKLKFQNSLIVDFYSYFREPWAIALFSDKFDCFQVESQAILLSKLSDGESLVDDIIKALIKSDWNQISAEDRENIESKFIGSIYQEEIENSLMDFLQYFEDELPMYCIPRRVREILNNFQDSPLFTTQ